MSRHTPYDSLNRELRRAETRRRKAQLVGASIGVTFLVGAALIAAVLVLNRTPTESPGSPSASTNEGAPVAAAEPLSVESSTPPSVPIETPAAPEASAAPEAPPEKRVAPVTPPVDDAPAPVSKPAVQKVSVGFGEYGYEPTVVRVKAGSPVQLTVAQGDGCAAGFLIPDLGISADNSAKAATISLPAMAAGIYRFTCGMEMVEGRLVVE